MYGAAERIHWTNARVVAELACGRGVRVRVASADVAEVRRAGAIIAPGRCVAARIIAPPRRPIRPRPSPPPARPAMPPPLLDNLNPEQLAAVTLPHASALILAGAGSGKTRVLTTRIAWLLATGQASPLSILAVTFTNKAAKEMLTRLSALTPVNTRGMWIGTFHGLCNRMLRAHYRDAEPAAALPDPGHAGPAVADQAACTRRTASTTSASRRGSCSSSSPAPRRRAGAPNQVEAGDDFARRQVEHYALYDAMCQREGVVDFAELLLRSYELLARQRRAARALPPPLLAPAGRRVPGHQRAAVQVAEAARRPAHGGVRGRRRRPVDLRVPRRQRRQHAALRARLRARPACRCA